MVADVIGSLSKSWLVNENVQNVFDEEIAAQIDTLLQLLEKKQHIHL